MSLAQKMLKSSVWVYAASWLSQLVGFISTIVLARILTPDDFGVVATAAIVTSLFHVLSSMGINEYILRLDKIEESDLNTAWSINIILKSCIGILTFILSDYAAMFLGDERVADILKATAFIPLISSLCNIGLLKFEKALNYKPQFKLAISCKLTIFVVKICLALYLENYWAFTIAEIIGACLYTVLSYYFCNYRPSFSFTNAKKQWGFSQWILAKGIFSTVRFKIDQIIIAKFLPTKELGIYNVAKDLTTLPVGQVIGPLSRPLYVGMANFKSDKYAFADKVQKVMLGTLCIVFPIAFGIAATAELLTLVILGDKWTESIQIIKTLAFIVIPGVLTGLMTNIMNILGRVKLSFYLDIALGLMSIALFVIMATDLDLAGFALLRVWLGIISFLIIFIAINCISEISIIRVAFISSPMLLAAIVMYICVQLTRQIIEVNSIAVSLVIQVVIGALIYTLLTTGFVVFFKKYVKEYDFLWQSFYLPFKRKLLKTNDS